MDHSMIGRLLGGLYIAVTTAMQEEAAEIAHEVLFRFADNPDVRPEDRRVYRLIALSADHPLHELKAENRPI
jgi:hypothetical protein